MLPYAMFISERGAMSLWIFAFGKRGLGHIVACDVATILPRKHHLYHFQNSPKIKCNIISLDYDTTSYIRTNVGMCE